MNWASKPILILALTLFLGSAGSAAHAAGGGGEYAPIFGLGVNFHNGTTGKSLTGATGYGLHIRAEKRKAVLRPFAAFDLEYGNGLASIGSDTPNFTLFGGGFWGGVNVFVFTSGRFQAYFGGAGVFSWHMLKLTGQPAGVEPNSQGMSFGYEARAGVDMRFGSAEGNAIRLESGYSSITSTLAGQSGFELSGFKLIIGVIY